jgi:hypothetical protein
MDPPYSTHLEYSGRPECIGELDAFSEAYFDAMRDVFRESERILRDRRYLAVYCCDTYKKKRGFVDIGSRFAALLSERLRAVDHIAVVRGNRKLERPNFHRAAAEENFFLRGFNHLLVFKKEGPSPRPTTTQGRVSSSARAGVEPDARRPPHGRRARRHEKTS